MNGFLLLDKPRDITSYKAVAMVKHCLGEKRVGHTGTLDPMATGVLPVLTGRGTALCGYMLDADKTYVARVLFGTVTDTDDITGNLLEKKPTGDLTDLLPEVLPRFTGELLQTPPMYSALKKDGRPLYELARQGKTVERKSRSVTVYDLKLLPREKEDLPEEYRLYCRVSKGTYIRSLARDLGEALGCGATLTGLRRVETAGFSEGECVSPLILTPENIRDYLRPPEDAVRHYKAVQVTEKQARRFQNGGELSFERLEGGNFSGEGIYRVRYNDLFLGMGQTDVQKGALTVCCVIEHD